jgi:hypothetical protein
MEGYQTYRVTHLLYDYWDPYVKSKHFPYELPTTGAVLADGSLVVGADAYKYRDDGSSDFVQLKPAVYIASGVEIDEQMNSYEPLRALLAHVRDDDGLRSRLKELLVSFFRLVRDTVTENARRHRIEYSTVAITIPNSWAEGKNKALQDTYMAIIAEVWPEKTIEVLFEVEALAHYLISARSDELQAFSRVIFVDNGGHTMVSDLFVY